MRLRVKLQQGSPWYGYVYFIYSSLTRMVKIGVTHRHPRWRLLRLQTGSPTPLEPLGVLLGGPCEEAWYHEIFARQRSHGEWFSCHGILDRFTSEAILGWPENDVPEPSHYGGKWARATRSCMEDVFEWLILNRVPYPDHPIYEPLKYDMSKHQGKASAG